MEISKLDQPVYKILKKASSIAKKYFENFKSLNVQNKKDFSPVSEADLKINDFLISKVSKLTPEIKILSEENESQPVSFHEKYFWLIDPLDGTKEFIKGSKNFSINLALVFEEKPIFGAIAKPYEEEIVIGSVDNSARLFKNDISHNLHPKSIKEKCIVSASASHSSKEEEKFFINLKKEFKKVDILKKGSSLKFCDLGSGISNIYPRFGPVYQWDLAAGQAILESLEGAIIFKNSEESIYKFDPSRKINGFIAVSSKEDEEKIKKLSFF